MSNTPELESCLVPGFVPSEKGGEIGLPTCVHCHVANSTTSVHILPQHCEFATGGGHEGLDGWADRENGPDSQSARTLPGAPFDAHSCEQGDRDSPSAHGRW